MSSRSRIVFVSVIACVSLYARSCVRVCALYTHLSVLQESHLKLQLDLDSFMLATLGLFLPARNNTA